jgi:hypothetical protein
MAASRNQVPQQDTKGHSQPFYQNVLWSKHRTRRTTHLGEEAMSQIVTQSQPTFSMHHNKTTDMAFVDILPTPTEGKIKVVDVSDILGIGTTVLGRFDEDGNLLGLTIENYKHFRRELMRKYLALAVDRIIGLLVDRVKNAFASQHSY